MHPGVFCTTLMLMTCAVKVLHNRYRKDTEILDVNILEILYIKLGQKEDTFEVSSVCSLFSKKVYHFCHILHLQYYPILGSASLPCAAWEMVVANVP